MRKPRKQQAGFWEEFGKGTTSRMPTKGETSDQTEETSQINPFEKNDTQDLLRLYRALMTVSRNGPLTSQPSRLLIKLIQELLIRNEKI